MFVGNVMELVEKIEKTGQNIQVDNLGESDFVVTYRAGKKESLRLGVDEDGPLCLRWRFSGRRLPS